MTATEPLTDAEFKARFLDTTLGTDQFHHADHVRMAWLFVTEHGMPHALDRFPAALRRYADAKGATSLFHATITWASCSSFTSGRCASQPWTGRHSPRPIRIC